MHKKLLKSKLLKSDVNETKNKTEREEMKERVNEGNEKINIIFHAWQKS